MPNEISQLLENYTPNLVVYWSDFVTSIEETLIMMFGSGIFTFILGLVLGTLLVVTREGNILENRFIYKTIDGITNIFRSIHL